MGRLGKCQVSVLKLLYPYSVFPKLFALSPPGACSTILLKMQCKQERKTEKVSAADQRCRNGKQNKIKPPNSELPKQRLMITCM